MKYEEIIDTASAKERFMGNYSLFTKFLFRFSEGELFDELERWLDAGDVKEAFETAHNMKGVAANLSLRLIEKPLYSVVEALRIGQFPDDKERKALSDAYRITIDGIDNLHRETAELF